MPWQQVWDRICKLQGQRFETKAGKPFSYSVAANRTVWIVREGRTINQSLEKSNFTQVYSMMQDRPLLGPAEINERAIQRGESQVRGPSYVWAILHDERVTP